MWPRPRSQPRLLNVRGLQWCAACGRWPTSSMPSPPVPVCLAGDAFSKTEKVGIMTTENRAVQLHQRCAFATHTSPAPAACLHSPHPIRRAPNRSSQKHMKIISARGRNLQQPQPAGSTTPPRPSGPGAFTLPLTFSCAVAFCSSAVLIACCDMCTLCVPY